jgi:hypothetical protein
MRSPTVPNTPNIDGTESRNPSANQIKNGAAAATPSAPTTRSSRRPVLGVTSGCLGPREAMQLDMSSTMFLSSWQDLDIVHDFVYFS